MERVTIDLRNNVTPNQAINPEKVKELDALVDQLRVLKELDFTYRKSKSKFCRSKNRRIAKRFV